MVASVYMATANGIVHRSLDFAGRSVEFATFRDGQRHNRVTVTATVGSRTVTGCTVDELFGKLVTLLDETERIHAVARIALRGECVEALHGEPSPPWPEHFTTVTRAGGRPTLTTITAAGPTLNAWAGRRS
jgi:hypothetical protein